jgi:hypothetical protein
METVVEETRRRRPVVEEMEEDVDDNYGDSDEGERTAVD